MKTIRYFGFIFSLLLLLTTFININYAQSKRSLNNDGVDLYSQKKYADSEVKFKKGLEKDPKMFEGNFNVGDSYFKSSQRNGENEREHYVCCPESHKIKAPLTPLFIENATPFLIGQFH